MLAAAAAPAAEVFAAMSELISAAYDTTARVHPSPPHNVREQ